MYQEMKYYVNGHTADGYVDFLSSNLVDINRIIVLQHPSNTIKTKVLKAIAHSFQKKNNIELIASPQNKEYLDGIIIRELSLAILNEKEVQQGVNIDVTKYFSDEIKATNNDHMSKITELYEEAYKKFNKGLTIHDKLEKVYINEMDFAKADEVAEDLIANLLLNIEKRKRDITIYERLFGTNTPDGIINHVEQLIEPIQNRVFVKGRAGTGKSVLMKKVLTACTDYGFDVELYRCSFDPNSIDMLIIRDLDFCIFDSTAPHEFFPTRKSDMILDLYEKTVLQGTDEKYAHEIYRLTIEYKEKMKEGIQKLEATRELEKLIESAWLHVNSKTTERVIQEIMKEL